MFSKRLFSPLRYPGGKARFAPFVSEVIRANGITGCNYVEPYAGGAGVALDLLFSEMAARVHINDLDPAVHAFWSSVVDYSDELLGLLEDTPITIDQWHRWRAVMIDPETATAAERGFATLFLNRTNRSGILKGGVIGGKAQSGRYRLDARFRKDMIRDRIEAIVCERDRISVYCEDAAELLMRRSDFLDGKGLIYLDPPYFVKGQGLYRNFYEPRDHQQIAELLQGSSFDCPWIVSYDNAEEIRRLYGQATRVEYNLYYTAQKRYDGSEQMYFSRGLTVPDRKWMPAERAVAKRA